MFKKMVMKKEEIDQMAMDLIKVEPEYTYRFWDSENNRTLLATGANLAEYPDEVAIICIEENQQICLSSLDLIKPESKIYFKSKIKVWVSPKIKEVNDEEK